MTYTVKLSMFPDWPIERQLPSRGPRWGEFEFNVNDRLRKADFWVVSIGLLDLERCICPPNRTLFVTYEPSAVHIYEPAFLDQFAQVLTCQRQIHQRNVSHNHQGQLWYAGVRYPDGAVTHDYDSLSTLPPPDKTGEISLITSRKTLTAAHRDRIALVERLQERLGDRLHVYGEGFKRVPDKLDAILPYRYHLVIENSAERDYWSEKLADAYLGWSFPIYLGCPNIGDFFPSDALHPLVDRNVDAMVSEIESVLRCDPYVQALPLLRRARGQVLNEHNFFERVARELRRMIERPAAPAERITLHDERHFLPRSPAAAALRAARSEWRYLRRATARKVR